MKKITTISAIVFGLAVASNSAFCQTGEGMAKDDGMAKSMDHEKMGKDHEKMGKHHEMMQKDGDKMSDGMKKDNMSK